VRPLAAGGRDDDATDDDEREAEAHREQQVGAGLGE
jgi:hypothetical protein